MDSKRGQEGVTITTLLLIVLGVVVVVVIILGATGIFGDIFSGGGEVIPSQLEVATQACRIALGAGLVNDYCYRFREIGDDIYANCEEARIHAAVDQQSDSHDEIECDNSALGLVYDAKADLCEGLDPRNPEDVKVLSEGDLLGDETCDDIDYPGKP